MTPLSELVETLRLLARSIPHTTKENRAIKGAYTHAATIAKEYFDDEKQQIEKAHMAGQRNAGIDPSAHSALAYYKEVKGENILNDKSKSK